MNTPKGNKMNGLYLLAGVMLIGFITTVTMICLKDNGATKAETKANELEGRIKLYATKEELKNASDLNYQAVTKTQKALEEYQTMNDLRNKLANDDFTELKVRVESMQMQVNKHLTSKGPIPPKVVHVKHTYDSPMQVDLNYPTKVQTKGKGRGALLEKAGVR